MSIYIKMALSTKIEFDFMRASIVFSYTNLLWKQNNLNKREYQNE